MQLKDLKPSFSELNISEKRKLIEEIREARLQVIVPPKKVKAKMKAKAKAKKRKNIEEMTIQELEEEAARLRALLREKE